MGEYARHFEREIIMPLVQELPTISSSRLRAQQFELIELSELFFARVQAMRDTSYHRANGENGSEPRGKDELAEILSLTSQLMRMHKEMATCRTPKKRR
jgi:hypothetical protein